MIEVTGENYFPDRTVVTINGTACANVSVNDAGTALSCIAPSGAGSSSLRASPPIVPATQFRIGSRSLLHSSLELLLFLGIFRINSTGRHCGHSLDIGGVCIRQTRGCRRVGVAG